MFFTWVPGILLGIAALWSHGTQIQMQNKSLVCLNCEPAKTEVTPANRNQRSERTAAKCWPLGALRLTQRQTPSWLPSKPERNLGITSKGTSSWLQADPKATLGLQVNFKLTPTQLQRDRKPPSRWPPRANLEVTSRWPAASLAFKVNHTGVKVYHTSGV